MTIYRMSSVFPTDTALTQLMSYTRFLKRQEQAGPLAWLEGSYDKPYDIRVAGAAGDHPDIGSGSTRLSHINLQQADYNWLTVELKHWEDAGRPDERRPAIQAGEFLTAPGNTRSSFTSGERDADNLYN